MLIFRLFEGVGRGGEFRRLGGDGEEGGEEEAEDGGGSDPFARAHMQGQLEQAQRGQQVQGLLI